MLLVNMVMETVWHQLTAMAHGPRAKRTAVTRYTLSLQLHPASETSAQRKMVILLRVPPARASAHLLLIAKESGKRAVLLARQQPTECGARYGRRLVRELLVQSRQTANTAKVLVKNHSTASASGPSARQIATTSGSRYLSGHLQVDEAVPQETATPPLAPQVKELAHPILTAKENGLFAQRLAKKLLNEPGCHMFRSLGEVGIVLRAQTAGTETVDA